MHYSLLVSYKEKVGVSVRNVDGNNGVARPLSQSASISPCTRASLTLLRHISTVVSAFPTLFTAFPQDQARTFRAQHRLFDANPTRFRLYFTAMVTPTQNLFKTLDPRCKNFHSLPPHFFLLFHPLLLHHDDSPDLQLQTHTCPRSVMYSNHPLKRQYSQMASAHPSYSRVSAYMDYLQAHSEVAMSRSLMYLDACYANRENVDPRSQLRTELEYRMMALQTQALPFRNTKQLQPQLGNASANDRNALQALSSNQHPGYYAGGSAAGLARACTSLAPGSFRYSVSPGLGTVQIELLSLHSPVTFCALPKTSFGGVTKKVMKE